MNSTNQNHWNRRRFFFFPLLLIGLFVVSAIVMLLWNWIIPAIFSLSTLTYWQAMGLFILCHILFGGFHCRNQHRTHHRFVRAAFKDKLMTMNDDERQQFKSMWKQRCCKKE